MRLKIFSSLLFVFITTTILAQHGNSITADEALIKLLEGNNRFVEFKQNHPHQDQTRLTEMSLSQKPFAVIVGCSDSRVPPEIIFDQGLGDLFVIRNAGNVVDDFALASIEYAVEHLDVKLIVVLGHERCGAVDAAVKGGHLPGHLTKLIEEINPSVEKVKKMGGDLLTNAVNANAERITEQLRSSEELLKEFVDHKELNIVTAYYDLDTGKVEIIK
ncbi:MAG: carbonic anhydrase [Melioribacteraceae bacterium]|nr:carbonic anhydrase [Melioribacteraceae bacterium]